MSGHTPGPWWPSRVHGTTYVEAKLASDTRLLQEVAACGPTFTPTEQEANARLIAAAPELLEALQWMVDNDDTNEGDEPLPDHGGLTWNEINAEFIAGLNKARAAIAKATGAQA